MKTCDCGSRLTSYRSINRGQRMLRYLRCKDCGATDKELVPIVAKGQSDISSMSLPTVGKDFIACPHCGHKINTTGAR